MGIRLIKTEKGFTLAELLVVIGIVTLMTGILAPNYREGSRQLALDRATHRLAQEIRRSQEMAMSMQQNPGNPWGYGIYLERVGSDYDIYLYADFNGNDRHDSGEDLEIIYKAGQGIYLENEVIIKDIDAQGAKPDKISFNFRPPDPIAKLRTDLSVDYPAVTVILALKNDTSKTKNIIVNQAGLIYAE